MKDVQAAGSRDAWSASPSERSGSTGTGTGTGTPGESDLSKVLPGQLYKNLMQENARLCLENKLLKENARLASENQSLRKVVGFKADVGPSLTELRPTDAVVEAWRESPGGATAAAPSPWFWPLVMPCDAAWPFVPCEPSQEPWPQEANAAAWLPYDEVEWAQLEEGEAGKAAAGPPRASRRRRQRQTQASVATTSTEASEDKEASAEDRDGKRTTVMLRNLPNNYSRGMVIAMLRKEGFDGLFNFFYLPIDFRTGACLGYAFVNLVAPEHVAKFWQTFDGYFNWDIPSKKRCSVTWSGPHQGYLAHVERYRNSPVMHASVPECCKPAIFKDGVQVPFPAPSKATRAPRMRHYTHVPLGAAAAQCAH